MSDSAPPAPASELTPEPNFGHPTGEIHWKRAGLSCGIGAGIVLGCVVLAAVLIKSRPEAPKRPRIARQASAEVLALKPRSLTPHVNTLGRVRPRRTVALSAQVSGEVVELHPDFEDGAVLPAGAILAKLDDRDVQHEIAQAKAQIAAIEADLAGIQVDRETLALRVDASKRLLAIARAELARMQDMEGSGLGTTQNVDPSRRAVVQSEDAVILLEANQRQLEPREARARASLAEAQARLAALELRLERAQIVMPFAGMVRDVSLELHQFVSPPQVICQVLEIDALELPVSLSLAEASLISPTLAPGQASATVSRVVNGRRDQWTATLSRFEPVDPDTQTVRAVLTLTPDASQPRLLPGLFCEVQLSGPPLPKAIVIPRSALQERGRVYLVEDGVLNIVPVEIGAQIGKWVEIRSGLSAGQEVVVSALDGALDGAPVTVQRAEEPKLP